MVPRENFETLNMQMQMPWAICRGPRFNPHRLSPEGPASGPDHQRPRDEAEAVPWTLYQATGTRECSTDIRVEKNSEKQTHTYMGRMTFKKGAEVT